MALKMTLLNQRLAGGADGETERRPSSDRPRLVPGRGLTPRYTPGLPSQKMTSSSRGESKALSVLDATYELLNVFTP